MQYIVQWRMQRRLVPWQVASTKDYILYKCNTLCSVGCKEGYCQGKADCKQLVLQPESWLLPTAVYVMHYV